MAYPNEVYTTFSFFGFLMCLIPFPCHLRGQNFGICLFIFWSGAGCLVSCINSVIWHGNAFNSAPTWCEISTRFLFATCFGLPASSLCITRRLYHVQLAAGGRTNFNKNKAMIFDLIVGLVLPLFSLPIYYISQGHRFNVYEDVGCKYTFYHTWISVVSVELPPFLMGCVSAVFTTRSIIGINKMRIQFKQLITTHSNMTYGIYFRLMLCAGTETLCVIPITFVSLISSSTNVFPWISWEDTHSYFNRVDQIPAVIWRNVRPDALVIEVVRWLYVVCAIILFCFFGITEEVWTFYVAAFRYALNLIGIRRDRRSDANVFKLDSGLNTSHSGDKTLSGNIDAISTQAVSDPEMGGGESS